MFVLGIILARAGSKGLPDKCVRPLLGRAVIEYTFDHVSQSELLDEVVFTTDSPAAAALAGPRGIRVIDRPAELANDTATVDAAARHAVETLEAQGIGPVDLVVLLYGNVPVRAEGIIDRSIRHLINTGADSVRTVTPVSKQHPDWLHRLDQDRMTQFRTNSIYRRQGLEPLYYHDGAVAAVTRRALFAPPAHPGDFQGFLGHDRRAIIQKCEDTADIDEPVDFYFAEAVLRASPGATGSLPASVSPGTTVPGTGGRAARGTRHPARRIRIGSMNVGDSLPNGRTFVIAEAGVNHNGDETTALHMVDAAAESGSDAVKFQLFRAEALTTTDVATATYQAKETDETSQRSMLARLELPTQSFERIVARCAARNIMFMATPFSAAEVDRLIALGTLAIKIASTDIVDVVLLERASRASVPLIVSTGAATNEEIAATVVRINAWGAGDRLILLHCVSSYPTAISDADLRCIQALRDRFNVPTGFSDHTTSTRTGALAVCAGACVLEKHFTLNRSASGPDHAMSLEPDSLREYVEMVREAESALGEGDIGVQPTEQEVRTLGRKSVVAARDIAAGEVVSAELLSFKRAGEGLPPTELDLLVGKRALQTIKADTPLTREMVK